MAFESTSNSNSIAFRDRRWYATNMLRLTIRAIGVMLPFAIITPLPAVDADRDFSGNWVLDVRGSNSRALPVRPEPTLTVTQQDIAIRVSAPGDTGGSIQWTYLLDGT